MTDEEFKELLENLSGSYNDFVCFMLEYVKYEDRDMVVEFIKNNSGVNDVDVLDFYDDNIWDGN